MWFKLSLICIVIAGVVGFKQFSQRNPHRIIKNKKANRFVFSSSSSTSTRYLFKGSGIVNEVWNGLWNLPFLQPSPQGLSPCTMGDAAQIMKHNIQQIYGGQPSHDGVPMADGDASLLVEGSMFLNLRELYKKYGGLFKLVFGPKSFIVISDPAIAKFVLKDNAKAYDKGILAEVLEPIMGKGLIPADVETWKVRKRAILPGFHKNWYRAMCKLVVECNNPFVKKLESACSTGKVIDMETEFCSISLDIIGKAIFNYDFGSVTKTSPVIKAVYNILKETEHRSVTPIPYWNLPLAKTLVPRLRRFHENLDLLNNVLNDLIQKAMDSQNQETVESLENRDYSMMENPSLLRFLVDMRGENATSQQLRDDLMTMLVAGHETTAAMLTWALFEMSQNPSIVEKAREEIKSVLGEREEVQFDDIKQLQYVRLILAESLRKYPEPPVLIRRAIEDHELPAGTTGIKAKIMRGTDLLIGVYNMHRSPLYWDDPERFNPERFLKPFSPNSNTATESSEGGQWKGYSPNSISSTMYPNEVHADYAFLPFGGGSRKCIGDQFAFMEAVVILSTLIRRFDFALFGKPSDVQMTTGATIHTKNGLLMTVKPYTG